MKKTLNEILVNGVKRPYIQDEVLLGNWEEVTSKKASEITHRDEDNETLAGLLFYGYEMKWGETNTNGERYEKDAFKDFIQSYFVDKGFNMPVTIEHGYNVSDIVGRVLYIETNNTGFYFVAYVPASCPDYARVKWLAEQGLIQGFSKEGYVTDGEWAQDWSYYLIKQIMMTRVSLVCTPANGVKFERTREIQNAVVFNDKTKKESCIDSIINH